MRRSSSSVAAPYALACPLPRRAARYWKGRACSIAKTMLARTRRISVAKLGEEWAGRQPGGVVGGRRGEAPMPGGG